MKRKTGVIDSIQMSKEGTRELVNKNVTLIKKIIKSKMSLYPLNFKVVFKKFVDEIKVNNCEMIRDIPTQYTFETYLESLIKKFLIKEAYFALEEECIQRRIWKDLKTPDKNDFNRIEIIDFVTARIEKNDLEKLNNFREKARFKTFLTSIVSFQIADYWRDHYKVKKRIEKYGRELSERYNIDRDDPLTGLIRSEDEEIKEKITDVLAAKRQEANGGDWVAFEMFYYEDMSLIAIARTFKTSVYKVKKRIMILRDSIIAEVLRKIK